MAEESSGRENLSYITRRHRYRHRASRVATGTSSQFPSLDVTHLLWQKQAACLDADPEQFFLDGPPLPSTLNLCRTCPVRQDCLDHAIDAGRIHGIWGGTTPAERAQMVTAARMNARTA